nr:hypothetical protein Iba_chr02aCG9970 [Ipomoea batatas]GMC60637.1 hypothetical protein Iba_chr02bCG12650 [Ipomoea batatas]GMC63026.1 hypothetical protein Iba_chr02cCG9420 [Ipomoea batatas]
MYTEFALIRQKNIDGSKPSFSECLTIELTIDSSPAAARAGLELPRRSPLRRRLTPSLLAATVLSPSLPYYPTFSPLRGGGMGGLILARYVVVEFVVYCAHGLQLVVIVI